MQQFSHIRLEGVPSTPFINTWFDVSVYLLNLASEYDPNHVSSSARLQVELVKEGESVSFDGFKLRQGGVEMPPTQQNIVLAKATAHLSVLITDDSLCHAAFRLCLRVRCLHQGRQPTVVLSVPMKIVRYRLSLMPGPDRFYKDMGGKTKMMEVTGSILDSNGSPPIDSIPLTAHLEYEGGEQVTARAGTDPQSYLVVNACYHDEQGSVLLRFRLNSVSKNHNGKRFRVVVKPQGLSPINPACCKPIVVLSKLPAAKASKADKAAKGTKRGGQKVSLAVKPKRRKTQTQETPPTNPDDPNSPLGLLDHSLDHSHGHATRSQVNTQKHTTHAHAHGAGAVGANADGDLSARGFLANTISMLEGMQWKLCGYHTSEGGIDYSRPLFRCPACDMYRSDTPYQLPHGFVPARSNEHAPTCQIANTIKNYKDRFGRGTCRESFQSQTQPQMPAFAHASHAAGLPSPFSQLPPLPNSPTGASASKKGGPPPLYKSTIHRVSNTTTTEEFLQFGTRDNTKARKDLSDLGFSSLPHSLTRDCSLGTGQMPLDLLDRDMPLGLVKRSTSTTTIVADCPTRFLSQNSLDELYSSMSGQLHGVEGL